MTSEESKAVVTRWFANWIAATSTRVVEDLIAEDYVITTLRCPTFRRVGGVRQYVRILKAAFPDAVHIIDDIIAEGDKVMTRVTARGTFLGECIGYPPTGRPVEISGIAVHRLANGRLIEHWAHADIAGFMQQIGGSAEPVQTR